MKIIKSICCIGISICTIIILLITSIEYVAYYKKDFYRKTYEKYEVAANVEMTMEDILQLTDSMMKYLKGKQDTLQLTTNVNNEQREFFSERELLHLEDVRHLFLIALNLRLVLTSLLIIFIIILVFLQKKFIKTLSKTMLGTILGFLLAFAGLIAIIASDFEKYFTTFHEIFFNNDLWLLDPQTDLLIRILPEGFFIDIGIQIAITFSVTLLLVSCINIGLLFLRKKPQVGKPA